ncbi:Origin recognition complex, subunit 2 [Phaffia rhodozyma]|uniref:Origin recognition complex subunit 2 n=1 Tax=Phaffia rhodozyma TaxID=264483 RepID=A0A0F7SHJ8_PHARH|nr:Origin recognition complex, subunit 2 [Phaffia rhodozyma]
MLPSPKRAKLGDSLTADSPSSRKIPLRTYDLNFSDATQEAGESDEDSDEDGDDSDESSSDTAAPSNRISRKMPSRQPSTTPSTPSSRVNTPSSTPRRTPSQKTPTKMKPLVSTGPFVRQIPSDAYFNSVARTTKTSSNVFSSLLPSLTQKEYSTLLVSSPGYHKNATEIATLADDQHTARFDTWLLELYEGFNLLFYGFGSKRQTLNEFAETKLSEDGDVIVLNGLFPKIGIRDLLNRIEDLMPEVKSVILPTSSATASGTSIMAGIELLAWKIHYYYHPPSVIQPERAEFSLFIIIHSFDLSVLLRSASSKSILGILASSPRIHLLLSLEHIHSPLLFSSTDLYSRPPTVHREHESDKSSDRSTTFPEEDMIAPLSLGKGSFNFLWHDLTTLQDYDHEISFRTSSAHLPTSASSTAALTATEEGARFILISVTDPARRLFKSLCLAILRSLETGGLESTGGGSMLTTPSWAIETELFFRSCQEKWIAREETRFKALLAEFKDHRLILESGESPAALGNGEASKKVNGHNVTEREEEEEAEEGYEDGTEHTAGRGTGRGKANARWLWIPLGKEAMCRLVDELADVP